MRDLLTGTWSVLNLVWFVMFFSVLFYAVLGLFIKGYVGINLNEETLSRIRTLFYVLSVGAITYSVYGRRVYMGRAREKKKDLSTALELYKNAVVVSVGVSNSIGVLGFLLLVLGDRFYGFPLLITAGLTMLYHRPRRSEMLSLTKEGQKRP
ncbi:MAG TPA: hypothetical protein EYH49_02815 [Aquifex aeolicus]|nr:hypothetical protein [Aquifex aeolicus]